MYDTVHTPVSLLATPSPLVAAELPSTRGLPSGAVAVVPPPSGSIGVPPTELASAPGVAPAAGPVATTPATSSSRSWTSYFVWLTAL